MRDSTGRRGGLDPVALLEALKSVPEAYAPAEQDRDHHCVHVVDEPGSEGRLFTAEIARMRANYVFSARSLVRVIGQYVDTEFDPALYSFPVPPRDGNFTGSILYSYKLNWQTVLFLGYGNQHLRDGNLDLVETDRSLFFKISYAIQR